MRFALAALTLFATPAIAATDAADKLPLLSGAEMLMPPTAERWRNISQKDEITDAPSYRLMLIGDAPRLFSPGDGPYIIITCDAPGSGRYRIAFAFSEIMFGIPAEPLKVDIRLDSGPARSYALTKLDYGVSTGMLFSEHASGLVKSLDGVSTLVIRGKSRTASLVTHKLKLGNPKLLQQMYASCGR